MAGIIKSVLIITVAISTNLKGQQLPEFGIKGGLNLATINNLDDTDYKAGVLLGAYFKLKLAESDVYLQPEVLYVQYGGKDANSDQSMTFNYIQIPVLLKLGFGASDASEASVSPNVFFGPYLGINTKAEFDTGEGLSGDIDEVVKDTDIGLVIGMGLDSNKLSLSLRYAAGLTSLYEDDFDDGEKNGAIAFTVGVGF